MFWLFWDAISMHAKAISLNCTWSCTEICTNELCWLIRSIIQWLETWQIALMKCRTGRPLTFNYPGTIKGWWTRCMYRTSWFAAHSHSCLFNLLTYLLWSSASTVVNFAADNKDGEGGIEDVCKRPPERLEGSRLGNLFGIPRNSAIFPISDLLDSGIFIGILFFRW